MNASPDDTASKTDNRRFTESGKRSFRTMMIICGFLFLLVIAWQLSLVVASQKDVVGDTRTLASYQFDLSNLTVDRELLRPFAVKDAQIPMMDPQFLTPEEATDRYYGNYVRKIVIGELVLGVSINGEAKAYPLRMLNWHEVINDTVGGVPVAVTWSPITQSAVVFDRRVGDQTLTFGYSGLLYNGNLVMYDRQEDPAGPSASESLWPQLLFQAVSGPLAGEQLRIVPSELVDWQDWSTAHPGSLVLQGMKEYNKRYKRASFSAGIDRGELPVAVEPWPGETSPVPPLHHVLATPIDDGNWLAYPITQAEAPDLPADQPRVFARWFAWHAFHGEQTQVMPPVEPSEAASE